MLHPRQRKHIHNMELNSPLCFAYVYAVNQRVLKKITNEEYEKISKEEMISYYFFCKRTKREKNHSVFYGMSIGISSVQWWS